jgi:hypothetical protein
MSQLQKLLDERWPLNTAMSDADQDHIIYARKLFEAGYNAAKEEAKQGIVNDDDLRAFHARMQENVAPLSGPLK